MKRAVLALLAAVAALALVARADEMSGEDKLRVLYSHQFTFTRDGVPLVTVELMHGQKTVRLGAEGGLRVLPDGDGGAEVSAGTAWSVTVEGARPAQVRWWVIVARQATDAGVALWKGRGYAVKTFETGIVFGVAGDVLDSRELLLGVAPEADEAAAARAARELAARWKVETSLHPEMVERPRGTIVARDDKGVTVQNPGVLWFAPTDEEKPLTVSDVVHGGGGSQVNAETRDTRRYHGRVYVTQGSDGSLTVVNAVPEDRLLAGILPSEIPVNSPPEALKAQAVAARDELLSKIGTRHLLDPFLLCSTQHCQVYGGALPEDARTTRAVAATRGEVLLKGGGGGLVPAYYSASCGGFGENNEAAWGGAADPSLRGRLDALGADAKALRAFSDGIGEQNVRAFLDAPPTTFCGRVAAGKGKYRWTVHVPAADLDRMVAAALPQVGPVSELRPLARGVSGRVTALRVVGKKGAATVEGELKIRRLFGGLKSSLFVVEARPGEWVFDGAGFGHGVGLCQTGAIGMAEAGYKYKQILEHYYPGSHVRKLY